MPARLDRDVRPRMHTAKVISGVAAADWAAVASAAFSAVAAGAACAVVLRAERDRWRRTLPDVHVELLADQQTDQVRLTVVNYGGPAREVRVMGVQGEFGFLGYVPPSTYWRSGESRTVVLSMPTPSKSIDSQIFVEARDMRKRQLFVTTSGGASYRWPLRKAKKMSAATTWDDLFPGVVGPLDVKYPMTEMRVLERQQ